jgi:putative peptidoglycan lipid II flippase
MKETSKATNLFGAGLSMTFFSLAAQAVGFLSQIVIAAAFGARTDMDAFIAASALPQYVIAVLVSALGFVFVPLFVEAIGRNREADAWRMASTMINLAVFALMAIAFVGIVLAEPLLRLTTPGLPEPTLELAAHLARILWPSILASGLISLLTGLYQVSGRFSWPAMVPFLGAIANLALLLIGKDRIGITAVAIAFGVSLYLQVALLLRVLLADGRYRFSIEWTNPFIRRVWALMYPLILVSLLSRCTPVLDRYFASNLPAGNIAHLSYAFRIATLLATLLSGGYAPALFPKMAQSAGLADMSELRKTISSGLVFMWILVAPVIFIGIAVATPVVRTVFVRGQFTPSDGTAVAGLLQIYLVALAGMCAGNLTGRCFYALQDTRTLAVFGSIETVAYALYAAWLVKGFGATGLALAYVMYFNISVVWQVFVLRSKIGGMHGTKMAASMTKTIASALIAAATAYVATLAVTSALLQVFLGLGVGLATYAGILSMLSRDEVRQISNGLKEVFRCA